MTVGLRSAMTGLLSFACAEEQELLLAAAGPGSRGGSPDSLACAQARSGRPDEVARTLAEAIEANPDLRGRIDHDPDLAAVREAGLLEAV